MHTEMTISVMFSLFPFLFSLLVFFSFLFFFLLAFCEFKELHSECGFTCTTQPFIFCSFGRFPSERTRHSYLKVMEPACTQALILFRHECLMVLLLLFSRLCSLKWINLCLYMEIYMLDVMVNAENSCLRQPVYMLGFFFFKKQVNVL